MASLVPFDIDLAVHEGARLTAVWMPLACTGTPPRSAPTRGVAAFLLALTVMFGCISCGGKVAAAVKLAENAAPIINDITRVLPPGLRIPKLTAENVAVARKKVEQIVKPYVGGVSEQEAREILQGACAADDLLEIAKTQTLDEAMQKVRDKFHPDFGPRVKGLAKDLRIAKDSGDAAAQAAAFALCESVGIGHRAVPNGY